MRLKQKMVLCILGFLAALYYMVTYLSGNRPIFCFFSLLCLIVSIGDLYIISLKKKIRARMVIDMIAIIFNIWIWSLAFSVGRTGWEKVFVFLFFSINVISSAIHLNDELEKDEVSKNVH